MLDYPQVVSEYLEGAYGMGLQGKGTIINAISELAESHKILIKILKDMNLSHGEWELVSSAIESQSDFDALF